jgi:outer membrane lipoprotein-sorting protein
LSLYPAREILSILVAGKDIRLLHKLLIFALLIAASNAHADVESRDAAGIVRDALNHWRGLSSQSELTMTVHRPDWERTMSMRSWTEGEKRSLVRITAPRKDRGNGTLIDGDNMWTFSPKINRVIKLPSSMMNQGWMGSDFSNKDISRTDEIVEQYDHRLIGTSEFDGLTIYEIESVPYDEAPVVWGREVLTIREDNVLIEQRYYDQDGTLVKSLRALEITEMSGRAVAVIQRMQKEESPDAWTEIRVDAVEFDVDVPDRLFTLYNLRNPRD